jgi:hypothetical protein
MYHFFAPFTLETPLEQKLRQAKIHPLGFADRSNSASLLIYDSPHNLMRQRTWLDGCTPGPDELIELYQQLAQRASTAPLISAWRLAALNPYQVRQWVSGCNSCPIIDVAQNEIEPLLAAVTKNILETAPRAVELYLNLECQAELAGGVADTNYLLRLNQSSISQRLIASWQNNQKQLEACEQQTQAIKDLQEESERFLHELQDYQTRLEYIVIAKREVEEQLKDASQKLIHAQENCAELDNRLAENQKQLASQITQARQELHETLEKLNRSESRRNELEDKLATSLSERESLKIECERMRNELEDKLATSLSERESLKIECERMCNELEYKLAANLKEFQSFRIECEAKIGTLKQDALNTLGRLHSTQEELEHYYYLSKEQELKIGTLKQDALNTLGRLHSTQEELEHYYHLSKEQELLLSQQNELTNQALLLAASQIK